MSLNDEKIWMFAIHHSALNLVYTDEASGELQGFNVDLVNAVCRIANKNCRLVQDYYKRCWNRVPGQLAQGGLGLFGRNYDGCVGWHHTYERARVFQFSDPWTQTKPGAFYVKPTNPRKFNWLDLTNKTIGFINGMAFNEHCISKVTQIKGNVLTENQIKYFLSRDELITAVLNEEIDASFDIEEGYKANVDVEQASDDIRDCVVAGMGMMVLKDSMLPQWWNPALKQLMNSVEYRLVCDDLKKKHGHWPGPAPDELCIGY
ncbi:arginine-binding periplasmic protein-like [Amphiura filiformis]|uniref:arginine-binding periplasmic protein-like n=1 Tax=Amphiura filiformis TaxID=82378 RepID=UPI003B21E736